MWVFLFSVYSVLQNYEVPQNFNIFIPKKVLLQISKDMCKIKQFFSFDTSKKKKNRLNIIFEMNDFIESQCFINIRPLCFFFD